MAAERIADRDDENVQVDFSDLERKYAVSMDMGLDTFIVVDGTPVIKEDKAPLLIKVLTKLFSGVGTIKPNGLHMPTKEGKTLGFAFIEYQTVDQANAAIKQFNGKRLDAKHVFTINKLSDIERYGSDDTITDEYVEPEKTEFSPRPHLRSWLTDPAGRDQIFAHIRNSLQVNWYKKTEDPPKIVSTIDHVEGHAKWSPNGTYLAFNFPYGVQLNGGPKLETIGQLKHFNTQMFDFSPNEQFIVTFSDVAIGDAPENDPDNPKSPFGEIDRGNQIVIWNTLTQLPMRSFKVPTAINGEPAKITWPIFKWSSDSKYFARIGGDQLFIYESSNMTLVDKKGVSIPGIVDFSFAPTSIVLKGRQHLVRPGQEESSKNSKYEGEHVICYWTPEINNQAARISIMTVPTKEVLRTRNVFNVSDCRFHWQDEGKYLCVKVDRFTRNKKSTFTNLEFFRLQERDIPVEAIELKDTVINFAWEPKGTKFITVAMPYIPNQPQQATAPGVAPGPTNNNILSFYGLEENKKAAVSNSSWKLLKSYEKKPTNSIYWAPNGRVAATSNFGPNVSTPTIEFYDTEYEHEKREGVPEDNSGIHLIGQYEGYALVNLQWDPSGRYIIGWAVKGQSCYRVVSFWGQLITERPVDFLRFVSWRPRPASPLDAAERSKILKNLDKYRSRFEEEDAMEADVATRELITKRRTLFAQWHAFRENMVAKLKSEGLVPEEESNKGDDEGTQLVEEIREEITEQYEEEVKL